MFRRNNDLGMFTGLKARCINVVCHSAIAQTYTAVANFYETYHHYLEELRRFSVYVTSTERLIRLRRFSVYVTSTERLIRASLLLLAQNAPVRKVHPRWWGSARNLWLRRLRYSFDLKLY